MYIHQFGKVFQVYPSSLVSLQKHCQPQEMEFSLVLCSLRLGYYFQERVACLKVSLIGFLISFVLFFVEVSLYRHFGILRDLTSMYIC